MALPESNYVVKFETFLDKMLPPGSQKCALFDCTAGKVFAALAVLSILGSVTSWNNFVSTVMWEVVIGLVVMWLCRSCRNRWAWTAVIIASGAPLLLIAILVIGTLIVYARQQSNVR
jgi:formate hydrogenlyase subunit 3/multisubunit Na+/H+ antiporter MnhD subunit